MSTTNKVYLLGRSEAEEARIRKQNAFLAAESDAQLERIGIKEGERVIDIGCGPGGVLNLLGKRVGPSGSVLGLEANPNFVEQARSLIKDHALPQADVVEGDAYDTGLPRASFDGAHMRLVLCNIAEPERIVKEMVSLVRPGGWVASYEADYITHFCDPDLPAWRRLLDAFSAFSAGKGIDIHVGRRTHRLFRDAGVTDIHVDATVHVYPFGHERQSILVDFIRNVRDRLIDGGFYSAEELDRDVASLIDHLANPDVMVTSHMFYRLSGRVPHSR